MHCYLPTTSKLNGEEIANYNNTFYDLFDNPFQSPLISRNFTPTIVNIKAFKADYILPLAKKIKVEAGIKGSWVKTDNNFVSEQLLNESWQNNREQSNYFLYEENIKAGYFNINKEFNTTSIQLGLRVENTSSTSNSITSNSRVARNYTDLFPSVFIRHELFKNHTIGVSYSKRIDRPDYGSLNPFVYYLDQYTYQKGNPYLNPQYTNNFEFNYLIMQKYSITLNYSKTKDVMMETILPDSASKGFYQIYQNLDNQYYYGLDISIPFKPLKWWNMDNNLNIFNQQFNAFNLDGEKLATKQTTWHFKTNQSFDFGSSFNGELSFSYRSAANYGVIKQEELYSFDVGLSKTFMNRKYNVKFAISDIFNSSETNISSAYPGFDYKLYQKIDSRRAKLTLTYRFGNNDVKASRAHKSGTESEQQRLKN